MIEMSTEWLCRDCETNLEKMIKVQEAISPRVSETGHVIPGVPCSIYMKQDVCEKCGVLKFVFEYEKAPEAVKEPETVIVAKDVEIVGDVIIESVLEEVVEEAVAEIPQKTVEEVIEEIEAEEETKEAEIERLKAQLAELEK